MDPRIPAENSRVGVELDVKILLPLQCADAGIPAAEFDLTGH